MKNHPSQMTTETLKGVRRGSKSRSVEATSARISNGLFSLSLSAWLCCLLLGLFAWSSEFYEAFVSLPVLDQFAAVTAFALFALGFAATVREFRTDFEERWMARIVGAAGVLFLVAFAYRMTLQVDRLQSKLAERTIVHGSRIAFNSDRDQTTDSECDCGTITATTNGGRVVSVKSTSRPLPGGTEHPGDFASGIRHFHGFMGAPIDSGDGTSGVLSNRISKPDPAVSF